MMNELVKFSAIEVAWRGRRTAARAHIREEAEHSDVLEDVRDGQDVAADENGGRCFLLSSTQRARAEAVDVEADHTRALRVG